MTAIVFNSLVKMMRFAGEMFGTDQPENETLVARDYSARDKEDDRVLLRALQAGEIGRGPTVDKAIQDIINRISGAGQSFKGI